MSRRSSICARNLRRRELEEEFAAADEVYKILRDLQ